MAVKVPSKVTDINAPLRSGSVPTAYDTTSTRTRGHTPFRLKTENIQLSFWINPSECSWRLPLRTTIEQVQGGAIHHEWFTTGIGKQVTQKFDQPIINMTFQAGNIAPGSWLSVEDTGTQLRKFAQNQPGVPPGLANFYDFLALLNEPNIKTDGTPNYVEISYQSLMLPNINLSGFFTQEGVQWTDNADNPNGISSWGASFVVFQATPPFFDRQQLRDQYAHFFQLQSFV